MKLICKNTKVSMKQVSTQVRGALCWWWFMGDAVVTGKNMWTNVLS